jgi:hypothetical protein
MENRKKSTQSTLNTENGAAINESRTCMVSETGDHADVDLNGAGMNRWRKYLRLFRAPTNFRLQWAATDDRIFARRDDFGGWGVSPRRALPPLFGSEAKASRGQRPPSIVCGESRAVPPILPNATARNVETPVPYTGGNPPSD